MSQESYDVNSPTKGSRFRQDGSYRSFICILLIFFFLCVIIIIFGNWSSIFPKKHEKTKKNDDYTHLSIKEDKKSQKNSDKDIISTISPFTSTSFDEWINERVNKSKEFNPTTVASTTTKTTTTTTTTTTSSPLDVTTERSKTIVTYSSILTSTMGRDISSTRIVTYPSTANYEIEASSSFDESFTQLSNTKSTESTPYDKEITRGSKESESSDETLSKYDFISTTDESTVSEISISTDLGESVSSKSSDIEEYIDTTTSKTIESNYSTHSEAFTDDYVQTVSESISTHLEESVGNTSSDIVEYPISSTWESIESETFTDESSPTVFESSSADSTNIEESTNESAKKDFESVTDSTNIEESTWEDVQDISTESESNSEISSNDTIDADQYESTTESFTVESHPTEDLEYEETIDSEIDVDEIRTNDMRTQTTKTYFVTSRNLIESSDVCKTYKCKEASNEIYGKMDHNGAPCEDFYEYSCGGNWKVNSERNWNIFFYEMINIKEDSPSFLKLYKLFYDGCVNFQYNIEYSIKLQEVIDIWNQTQIIEYSALDKIELEAILALVISLKSMHFMDIGKGIDRETGNIVLKLKLPEQDISSIFLADNKHCLSKQWQGIYKNKIRKEEEKDYNSIFKDYTECVNNNIHFENTYKEALGKVVKKIRINKNIYNMLEDYPSLSKIDEEMMKKNYSTYYIEQMDKKFPGISWRKLFSVLLNENLDENFKVQVYFQDYFEKWFKKFNTLFGREQEKKIFLAHTAMTDMYYNYVITRKADNIEAQCIKLTADTFTDISSYIYFKTVKKTAVDSKFVQDIFNEFKSKLKQTFSSDTYMSKMGSTCSKKIDDIDIVFNSDRDAPSDEELTDKYKNLDFENKPFIDIIVTIRKFQMKNILKSKHIFGNLINPYDKELAVIYESNKIYVPFGFLESVPKDLPKYIKMARIGVHVGKALAKFFDPTGMPQIVPESSLTVYKNIFGNINRDSLNPIEEINSDLLVNEAIADNAACRLVTDSVQTSDNKLPWLVTYPGNKQIFYIALAQEFCENLSPMEEMRRIIDAKTLLGSYKVNNMMMNSPDFAKTFQCLDGTKLNTGPKLQFPHINDEYLVVKKKWTIQQSPTQIHYSEIVCNTLECKSGTKRNLSFMAEYVNPCEDFYKFSYAAKKNENVKIENFIFEESK